MTYPIFHDYILSEETVAEHNPKELGKFRHNFYALQESAIQDALGVFDPFPVELKQFYEEIGFGYFHCNKERANRIFDPYSLIMMNRLEDRFEYDVELKRALVDGHLVFFQTYLYQFFTIDRNTVDGGNAIYYKKHKIADSLQEFLQEYSDDRKYLSYIVKDIDKEEINNGITEATPRNTFVYISEDNQVEDSAVSRHQEAAQPETPVQTEVLVQPANQSTRKWSPLIDDDGFVI
jgi:hypothetical protein